MAVFGSASLTGVGAMPLGAPGGSGPLECVDEAPIEDSSIGIAASAFINAASPFIIKSIGYERDSIPCDDGGAWQGGKRTVGRNCMKSTRSICRQKSLSHELPSERASERMSAAERASEANSAEQANE